MYQSIIRIAIDYLSARADPAIVQKYSRYFKEGYDAWGNQEGEVKEAIKLIDLQFPDLKLQNILKLGDLLFQHGKYEAGSVAIVMLYQRKAEYTADTFSGLKRWFDFGVSNWGHSDYLCTKVMPELLSRQIVPINEFADWVTSPSRWTRRAVPVSLLCLRKSVPPAVLLSMVEPLLLDSERVVHQGLGWFLRELWKQHPSPVEDILYQYRNTAARLIIQYATEKMTKEQKLRYRKDKK
jgi:3-methyladenine DNA glycosylase AlkD